MSRSFRLLVALVMSLFIVMTPARAQIAPPASAAGALTLSDSDIDSINNVTTLRHLLKQYSAAVRSSDAAQAQTIAKLTVDQKSTQKALLTEAMTIALLSNVFLDAADAGDKAADQLAEAQEECRNLSTLQTAVTGGLALKPAPYGQTYLSIFGFLSPFLFKKCTTGTVFKPALAVQPETKKAIRSLFSQLQIQYNAL